MYNISTLNDLVNQSRVFSALFVFLSVRLLTGLFSFKLDQSHSKNTNTHTHKRPDSPVTSFAFCNTLIRPSLSLPSCLSHFLCLSCIFCLVFLFFSRFCFIQDFCSMSAHICPSLPSWYHFRFLFILCLFLHLHVLCPIYQRYIVFFTGFLTFFLPFFLLLGI